MYYHHSIVLLLLLLHTFSLSSSSPIPHVQSHGIVNSDNAHGRNEQLNYYELLCALYNDCEHVESNEDIMPNKIKPKRLTSNLFHGIPKFGKRAFVSAFSGIPKFG